MIKTKSIRTKFGWLTAYENNGKIFKIKFEKVRKQSNSKVLKKFRYNLLKFFSKKTNASYFFRCKQIIG